MMKGYLENQKQKDAYFLERKRMLAEKAKKEGEIKEIEPDTTVEDSELQQKAMVETIEGDDPWMQRKTEQEQEDVEEQVKVEEQVHEQTTVDIASLDIVGNDA
jgi:hypothetical protein